MFHALAPPQDGTINPKITAKMKIGRSQAGITCGRWGQACSSCSILGTFPASAASARLLPRRGTWSICPKPHRVREPPRLPETTRNGPSLALFGEGFPRLGGSLDAKESDDRNTRGSSSCTLHLHVRQAGRAPSPPSRQCSASVGVFSTAQRMWVCQWCGFGLAVPRTGGRETDGRKGEETCPTPVLPSTCMAQG